MSSAQEERDRLKEEYKAHYRSIQQTKRTLAESERMAKIGRTLQDMNADHLLEGMDTVLRTVREKIELAEAKLEMAMEGRAEPTDATPAETLQRVKAEIGLLQDELDAQVQSMHTRKTLGPKPNP
jgi:hypothetical protein